MGDVLQDDLDREVAQGFDGELSVIIETDGRNPSRFLDDDTEVSELGFDLYEAEVCCDELKRLAENVQCVERNGTGTALNKRTYVETEFSTFHE